MTAYAITTDQQCRNCGASLTLEEMHYFEDADGSCTCEACERAWHEAVGQWLAGHEPGYPEQP